jgi:hypothetical protein
MRVELLWFRGCPHAASARDLLRRCVEELGLDVQIEEREGDHPSPSILVDGRDVMGSAQERTRACRIDVPVRERILAALRAAGEHGDENDEDCRG